MYLKIISQGKISLGSIPELPCSHKNGRFMVSLSKKPELRLQAVCRFVAMKRISHLLCKHSSVQFLFVSPPNHLSYMIIFSKPLQLKPDDFAGCTDATWDTVIGAAGLLPSSCSQCEAVDFIIMIA